MRVDARTRSAAELDEFLKAFSFPLVTHLRDTQVYVYCARDGYSGVRPAALARRAGLGAVEAVDALDRAPRGGARKLTRRRRAERTIEKTTAGTSRIAGRRRTATPRRMRRDANGALTSSQRPWRRRRPWPRHPWSRRRPGWRLRCGGGGILRGLFRLGGGIGGGGLGGFGGLGGGILGGLRGGLGGFLGLVAARGHREGQRQRG